MKDDLKTEIKRLVIDILKLTDEDTSLSDEENLIDLGLTSIDLVTLVVSIEKKCNIEIANSDLYFDNFKSINNIYSTISKYVKKPVSTNETAIKKVLVCDCDGVLWNGVAGEGCLSFEEKWNYHSLLFDLYHKGVLLCICSKNSADSIYNAFLEIPSSLSLDLFVSVYTGVKNKAQCLLDIAHELNLDIRSFVFVDDSNYETGLINKYLPQVYVVKPDQYGNYIDELRSAFALSTGTSERTVQYLAQKERIKQRIAIPSIDEYNKAIKTQITIRVAQTSDTHRIAELSQRTNKFNLSSLHLTNSIVNEMLSNNEYLILVLSASDLYGDMGIVASAIVNITVSLIIGFFVSCRVFDRGFEKALLKEVLVRVGKEVKGLVKESSSNKEYINFYQKNGLETAYDND